MRNGPRWIATIVLMLAAMWLPGCGGANDLFSAVNNGEVTIAATAERPDRTRVTVTRTNGAQARSYVLPAGIILMPSNERTQRLMTAATVEVRFAAGETEKAIDVETYCLDQFKTPPLEPTPMVPMAPYQYVAEENNEFAKLADCLQDKGAPLRRRQVAIWIVKGGFLDKSYDEATDEAARQFEDALSLELQERIHGELGTRLRRARPGISDAEVQRQLDRFTADKLRERVRAKAAAMTRQAFGRAKAEAQALLEQCGYPAATARFFQTAPQT